MGRETEWVFILPPLMDGIGEGVIYVMTWDLKSVLEFRGPKNFVFYIYFRPFHLVLRSLTRSTYRGKETLRGLTIVYPSPSSPLNGSNGELSKEEKESFRLPSRKGQECWTGSGSGRTGSLPPKLRVSHHYVSWSTVTDRNKFPWRHPKETSRDFSNWYISRTYKNEPVHKECRKQ